MNGLNKAREIGYDEGWEEGRKEGLKEGLMEGGKEIMMKLIAAKFDENEIAQLMNMSLEEISSILRENP